MRERLTSPRVSARRPPPARPSRGGSRSAIRPRSRSAPRSARTRVFASDSRSRTAPHKTVNSWRAAGRIGYEAATMVARVAGLATVHAWVERPAERTVKHLREENDAVQLVARVEGRDQQKMGPPDAAMLEEAQAVERSALRIVTGAVADAGAEQMSAAALEDPGIAAARPRRRATCRPRRYACRSQLMSTASGAGWRACIGSPAVASRSSRSSSGPSRRAGASARTARSRMPMSTSATAGAVRRPCADRAT